MPKVLFVSPSAYALSGLATWLDYLVPGLADHGWDACLGLVSGPRHHRPERYLSVHPVERVAVAHCNTGTAEGRLRAIDRLLNETRPDIAVSVNIPDLFAAINQRRLEGRSAPHAVMSVHGIEAYLYADAARYGEMLDSVICTNRLACALTRSLGEIPPSKIRYSAYGVCQPESAEHRSDERLRIVYSGRLEESQKRTGDLVGIVNSLQRQDVPFCLEIAGDGPDRASLETALGAEIAAGKVQFHGHVPLDELKTDLYPSAHAMVITSSWETGPIVAWEAMAQGLPVVSSRYIGSGLEGALVDRENSRLFDIGDVEAAAAALVELWRAPETRSALSRTARQLVTDRYSIQVSVKAWSDNLHAILEQPQVGPMAMPKSSAQGRLDKWVGNRLAESIRSAMPSSPNAPDAGGEWPHSHTKVASDASFWRIAASTDKHVASAETVRVA